MIAKMFRTLHLHYDYIGCVQTVQQAIEKDDCFSDFTLTLSDKWIRIVKLSKIE